MRDALEAAIRARIQQAAPQLVGDLWGRDRVVVIVEELARDALTLRGRVVCELYADAVDDFPVPELVLAMQDPIEVEAGGMRAAIWCVASREHLAEGMAVCQLIYDAVIYT